MAADQPHDPTLFADDDGSAERLTWPLAVVVIALGSLPGWSLIALGLHVLFG